MWGFAYAWQKPEEESPILAAPGLAAAGNEVPMVSNRRRVWEYLRALGLAVVSVALVLDLSLLVVGDPARLPGPLGPLMEERVIPWAQDVVLPWTGWSGVAGGEDPADSPAGASGLLEATATPTTEAVAVETPVAEATATTGPSPTAVPATPTPRLVAAPARIVIPAASVDAPVVRVGVDGSGRMGTPRTAHEVGWYGPSPGEAGNALLAGHVDWLQDGKPVRGAFYLLRKAQPGDEVTIYTADGETLTFRVAWVRYFEADNAPVEEIAGPTAEPSITLITCGGDLDRTLQSYSHRWVVRATIVDRSSNE